MSDAHRDEIAKLESLYAEHPEGRIFTHLAEAYRKAGELDRAQQVLSEGLDRHPDYSSAHVVLGRVYMDQDRTEDAEAEFRRVLELDPHNLIAVRALGNLAHARGADDQALEWYRRVLEQEPSDEEVQELVDSLSGATDAGQETEDFDEFQPRETHSWEDAAPEEGVDFGGWTLDEEVEAAPVDGQDEPRPAESDAVDPSFDWSPEEPEPSSTAEGLDQPEPQHAGERHAAGDAGGVYDETDRAIDDSEVRTETIAQVYARQGLYDRAAEVYRQLVRSRPDDESLRERLAEMEELAAAQEGGTDEVEAVSDFAEFATEEGEPKDAGEFALEGFESGEVDLTAASAEAIEGLDVHEADPETGLRADTTPETADPEEDLSEELAVTEAPEPPEEMPWEMPYEEPAGTASVEDEGPDELAESVWTGGDWSEAEEEPATPHAWTHDEEDQADSSPPIREYFGGLLGWSGSAAAEASEEDVAAAGPSPDASARPGAPSQPGTDRSAPSEPGAEPDGSDDDDLEMFRSWLESLKQ